MCAGSFYGLEPRTFKGLVISILTTLEELSNHILHPTGLTLKKGSKKVPWFIRCGGTLEGFFISKSEKNV